MLRMMLMVVVLTAGAAFAAGLPPEVQAAADNEIAAARSAGLPAAALEAKAREGAAKGVTAARIAEVLRTMRAGLERAAAIVAAAGGPGASGDAGRDRAVEAIAEALRAGVTDEQARAVVAEAASDGKGLGIAARASSALTDFVVEGMPAQASLGLVKVAIASEGGEERFVGLAAAVNALRRSEGISAEEAIARLTEEMRAGRLPYEVLNPRGQSRSSQGVGPAGAGAPGQSGSRGVEQREIHGKGKGLDR